ncbi:MAG: putative methyltransferase, partial [Thermoplasmata archaeon]
MVEGLIREIEKRTNIQVYERSIMNVLGAVLSSDDFWEIVDLSEEPLPLVAHTIDVLRKKDYIRIEEGISLTEKGRKLAEDLGVSPIKKLYCRRCSGRGLDLDEFGEILKEFRKVT